MQLFHEENYTVTIAPEAKLIPGIKRIWTRDKHHRKVQAMRELSYIYFMCHWRSPYRVYSEKDRHDRLVKYLKMPEGWTVDGYLETAIEVFKKEILNSEAVKSLVSVRAGLVATAELIDLLRTRIEREIDKIKAAMLDEDDEGLSDEEEENKLSKLMGYAEKLLKMSNSIPATIATISDLEEKVKKEQTGDSRIKGGGEVGLFED